MVINTPFILASKSLSRKKILKNNGLNFKQIKPTCNEEFYKKNLLKQKKSPTQIAKKLSTLKAKSISAIKRNILVLGSDTTISFEGRLIEKAKNIAEAKEKIQMLSGKNHTIISAASVYYNNKLVWFKVEKTIVKLRKLNNKEINNYLKKTGKKILGCVGCYQIEEKGPNIIEKIRGDYFNVMGFPLFLFLSFLIKQNKRKYGQ